MQRIACSHCGHRLKFGDEHVGKKAKCPKCGHSFRVAATGADDEGVPSDGGGFGAWAGESEDEILESLRRTLEGLVREWAELAVQANAETPGVVVRVEKSVAANIGAAHFLDEANREIDAAPRDRRLAVARKLVDRYTGWVADARRRAEERRKNGLWNLLLLAGIVASPCLGIGVQLVAQSPGACYSAMFPMVICLVVLAYRNS